ncbi:membrane dipeptidase [Variovorax guangxiensis]|uniref:dipeptidase n=1 Tax=Variovorax guangxiensis TaxID=1775474 RepID=UPI002863E720|nr:membrane dipeptidase [Variovorax guangxiensis]MDR6858607.1 membrane dipeptidase [Variovorax guangxiensis]
MASVHAMLSGGVGPDGSTDAARVAEDGVKALEVLRRSISVDVHTHGGPQGIYSPAPPNGSLAAGMRAGSLAAVCLSEIPDEPLLGRNAAGITGITRLPSPDELYRHHLERLAWADEMVAHHGLQRALTAADLVSAHTAGQPALIGGVEGLDFLEGKLERLEEAHQRGIRSAQLVHYTPNDIGDFQMGMVTHEGLTAFGIEVIRDCHRLGMVVDVAHATEKTAKAAAKVSTKPLLLSHTALAGCRAMASARLAARQVTPDHARAIAETGGGIGIWAIFPDLDKYVEGLKEMVDVAGVDHVCVGTDQQVAPGALQDYAQWVNLISAMLRGGFTAEEAGKIAGGNYLRIFRAAVG